MAFRNSIDWDSAIEAYSKAIELDSYYADAYNGRGDAYYNKSQRGRAIEDYTKVISLKPDDALAYLHRGFMYWMNGQLDRALPDFEKGCEHGNNDACRQAKVLEMMK